MKLSRVIFERTALFLENLRGLMVVAHNPALAARQRHVLSLKAGIPKTGRIDRPVSETKHWSRITP